MDPELLRGGMRIGVLIALLAAVILPFQDPASASFVVDVLALLVGLLFIAGVAMVARLTSSPLPRPSRDSSIADRYNERNPSATRTGGPAPGGKEE
ncbi:MAG: hypothetical protein AUH85_05740 [Chloroflexi bacterium 13_1_40CM_4_68_4]|nr:MAG: hypothetical protein AUH85_05740 [Chloroflexi bacterium 13_1_40CM_4_68_4]